MPGGYGKVIGGITLIPIPSGGERTPNGAEFKLVVEELECAVLGLGAGLLIGIPPTDTPGPKLYPPQGPRIGGGFWFTLRFGGMAWCCGGGAFIFMFGVAPFHGGGCCCCGGVHPFCGGSIWVPWEG
jgi:hypothetical protein